MQLSYLNPEGVYPHPQFTSIVSASSVNTFHFFAGRLSVDGQYNPVAPQDMLGQFRHVMELLTKQLAAVGADWSNVVHRRIFTLDIEECLKAQEDPSIMAHFDRERMPASTMIEVNRLSNPDLLIEIEIVAVT
jgi:enamine deaminase RidA (YjgF/YER057c/UK114 family)